LLFNNATNEHPIQVFQKTKVNQWIDKGAFKISDITESPNEVKVSLVSIKKLNESI